MRPFNFSAGPCTLPLDVLVEAESEFVDYRGTGMSLIEMSHRSPEYDEVHTEALAVTRRVFDVPDSFDILFLQGGATLQFAMVPMNLLDESDSGGYLVTGTWGSKALEDGRHHGRAYAAWDGREGGYTAAPAWDEISIEPNTRYIHATSNETIHGVQIPDWSDPGVPMVIDMSSDFLTRPVPWALVDVVYGGAQKNLGPAGLTVVFVRKSILDSARSDLASYLRYIVHASTDSLYNTPPMFAIWMMGKTLKWVEGRGGLSAMQQLAASRARLIYDTMDASDGFYTGPVHPGSRSRVNVVFRLPDEQAENDFLDAAEREGLLNLRGHRSVGGVRASMYNAMPLAGAEALAAVMDKFR